MEETVEKMEEENMSTEMTQPVIVDLGSQKTRKLKALKKAKGELWDEVLDVMEEVKESLGADAEGKILVPVVMIYRRKPAKGKSLRLNKVLFPLMK
jgi:hypothetical protein